MSNRVCRPSQSPEQRESILTSRSLIFAALAGIAIAGGAGYVLGSCNAKLEPDKCGTQADVSSKASASSKAGLPKPRERYCQLFMARLDQAMKGWKPPAKCNEKTCAEICKQNAERASDGGQDAGEDVSDGGPDYRNDLSPEAQRVVGFADSEQYKKIADMIDLDKMRADIALLGYTDNSGAKELLEIAGKAKDGLANIRSKEDLRLFLCKLAGSLYGSEAQTGKFLDVLEDNASMSATSGQLNMPEEILQGLLAHYIAGKGDWDNEEDCRLQL